MTQNLQPLQRQRQMRSTLVIRDRMNLVDNHRLDIPQDRAALIRR